MNERHGIAVYDKDGQLIHEQWFEEPLTQEAMKKALPLDEFEVPDGAQVFFVREGLP